MKMKSAWLGTWEGTQEDGKRVAFILNYRLGGEAIREFVERLYVSTVYGPIDQLSYAKNRRKTPYPAAFGQIQSKDGKYHRWGGQISCGHNPFILARLVNNLHIIKNDEQNHELVWEERPRIIVDIP